MDDPSVKRKREAISSSRGSEASGSARPPRSKAKTRVDDLIEDSAPRPRSKSGERYQLPLRERSLARESDRGSAARGGSQSASVHDQGSRQTSKEPTDRKPETNSPSVSEKAEAASMQVSYCVPFRADHDDLDPIVTYVYDTDGEQLGNSKALRMDQLPALHQHLVAQCPHVRRLFVDFLLMEEMVLDTDYPDIAACLGPLLPLLPTYDFAVTCQFRDDDEEDAVDEEEAEQMRHRQKSANSLILAKFLEVALAAGFVATLRADLEETWLREDSLTIIRFAGKRDVKPWYAETSLELHPGFEVYKTSE